MPRLTFPGRSSAGGGAASLDPELLRRQDLAQAQALHRPSEQERALVALVAKRFKQSADAKGCYLETWATDLAFYVGDHYREWSRVTRQLVVDEQVPSWRVRLTDNQITQLVLTVASKRAKAKFATTGAPNDPQDPGDVDAARIASRVLRHLDRVTERSRKRLYAELLSTIYGTAFLHRYWDAEARVEVATQDPMTGQVRPAGEAYLGECQFEVLSPWEVFPAPCSWWHDVRWCVLARVRPLDWFLEIFGDRGKLVQATDPEEDLFAAMAANASRPGSGSGSGGAGADSDSARCFTLYERPCPRYPKGRWIITAGEVLLYQEDAIPHAKQRFPVIPYIGIFVPERLWGMGWVEHQTDQQRRLNRVESQIAENCNLMGRPKWTAARESNVEEEALNSSPGEVIEYDWSGGAPAPAMVAPPALPSYIADMPEIIIARMQGISGQHEVTASADTPSNVSSGVAIDLLQEQDESRLAITSQLAGESWRQLDQDFLEDVQANYTVPRYLRVVGGTPGPLGEPPAAPLAFMGSDLAGNTEVALETHEGVQDSQAALRQRVLDYVSGGIMQMDPTVQQELFSIMGESQLAEMAGRLAERQALMMQEQAAAMEQEQGAMMDAQAGEQEQMAAQEQQAAQQAEAQAMQQQEQSAQQMELERDKLGSQEGLAQQGNMVKMLQALLAAQGRSAQQAAKPAGKGR